jgi:hypothetical protein
LASKTQTRLATLFKVRIGPLTHSYFSGPSIVRGSRNPLPFSVAQIQTFETKAASHFLFGSCRQTKTQFI